jgi:hypothetical protein
VGVTAASSGWDNYCHRNNFRSKGSQEVLTHSGRRLDLANFGCSLSRCRFGKLEKWELCDCAGPSSGQAHFHFSRIGRRGFRGRLIRDITASVEGPIINRMSAGDHEGFLIAVRDGGSGPVRAASGGQILGLQPRATLEYARPANVKDEHSDWMNDAPTFWLRDR